MLRLAASRRRLCRLPLAELCPRGFLLVWVHKGLIPLVCRQLGGIGYGYVENLTWVMVEPGNAISRLECKPSPAACSHRTLLIFRKEGEAASERAAGVLRLRCMCSVNLCAA